MALLLFSPERCVRALSVNSACRACVDACPTTALSLEGRLPSINHAYCAGCAGCGAVCPTEAMKMDDFDPTGFFFAFASETDNLVSCQKNVPCIAALGSEHLISLAGLKQGVVLDTGHCAACDLGAHVLAQMESRLSDVNYLLEAIDSPHRCAAEPIGYRDPPEEWEAKDRRDFFKTFHLRGIGKIRRDFENEVQGSTDEFINFSIDSSHTQGLRTKKITDRRKLFFMSLKRMERPETYHVVDAAKISFTSQKLLDEGKCTACQMCYRVCPTAALTSDVRNSKIDFDPFLCVKCHLCHDVCETDAITVSTSYNLREWFEPKVQNLVTYSVRRCDECDALFSSVGGEKICRRCRLEEEEAMELWGLQ